MTESSYRTLLAVRDYDLAATLGSGQAFRWRQHHGVWSGVIGSRAVRLQQGPGGILAEAADVVLDWSWPRHYLQTDVDLAAILSTFPDDKPMQISVTACRGLRLLRQEPWECLASFIASSTKQIVQIQQIVELLCARFGEPVAGVSGHSAPHAFPAPEQIARASETELRACKLGFRAPYLLAAARAIAESRLDLTHLQGQTMEDARERLTDLPGVGEKIANCVLLFAYGFQQAFPVDVWVMKALRELYYPRRRPQPKRLREFVATHFGPNAGYAQQYLFHYMRTQRRLSPTRP